MSDDKKNPFEEAYHRERKTRRRAEQLLEDKSRMLHQRNQELEQINHQLLSQQASMLKQEKLATLGTLAAGVAHEINNPLAFVTSNISALDEYHGAYHSLYKLFKDIESDLMPDKQERLQTLVKQLDLEYLDSDLPHLMKQTLDGLDRVRKIVLSLRNFSRSQEGDRDFTNINEGIESTLRLVQSELKHGIDVVLDLKELPKIYCNPSEINQVILNIVVNASHALKDRPNPTITISTYADDKNVFITIEDNGIGMSAETLNNIFVPFYTTKPIGQGTGMGMAIAHKIISEHHGSIDVSSEINKGTCFSISLPQHEKSY
jgi:two-component system NtrC family sensor kinase